MIERVEDPGRVRVRKAQNGQRAQMAVAQHRFETAVSAAYRQNARRDSIGVSAARRRRCRLGRNRAVQIGQGLAIIERRDFRHEPDRADRACGRSRRRRRQAPDASRASCSSSPVSISARSVLATWSGGGMKEQGQIIGVLEMLAFAVLLPSRAAPSSNRRGAPHPPARTRRRGNRTAGIPAPRTVPLRRTAPIPSRTGAIHC